MSKKEHPNTEPETTGADTTNDEMTGETTTLEGDQEARIRELEARLEDMEKQRLYLMADVDNIRRHAARERVELQQTAGRDILAALLPVLDDFDRAAKNGQLSEGVSLIQHKLVYTVEQKGLRSMQVKPGDPFNVEHHEAVVEIPAASEEQKGTIVDIIEQGYILGNLVLRFAKVVVAK